MKKVSSWLAIFLLSMLLVQNGFSQDFPSDPELPGDPIQEDKIYYTCETYTDGGEFKLSALLNFTLETFTGTMEVLWVNESTYGELHKLRQSYSLNATKVKEATIGKKSVFIIESKHKKTVNNIKLIVPMRPEIYEDTMGELYINDVSFEVKCSFEIDTY